MKSIGIDIGTTTISIIVMNTADFTIEESCTLDNGAFLPSSRPWERIQDVSGILRKTQTALEEILDRTPDISSIGLTGQMHGIVYVDQAGTAVSPLYTWQDGRGNQPDFRQGKSVCACLSEDYGVKAASGYGMVTHLYNVQKGLVPRKAVSFCTISDYLGMALTGRSLPLLHISQAASLGFVSGTGEGKFEPDALVNREQAAVMLSSVYAKLGGEIPAVESTSFADDGDISGWARSAVAFMNGKGIVTGIGDNSFGPKSGASIEQALLISLKMFETLK